MSIERLKAMKEIFMCAVEGQMYNLAEVDAEELGEVVDMIKDLSEAIYYCEVAKAMEESEHSNGNYLQGMTYYAPSYREKEEEWHEGRQYYGGNGSRSAPSSSGKMSSGRMNGMNNNGNQSRSSTSSQPTEREFPGAFQDEREGRSPRSRKMYMEAKETQQDKAMQMKELEKYAQELTNDILEMISDATPEEKQYLSKKMTTLANKLTQLNGDTY